MLSSYNNLTHFASAQRGFHEKLTKVFLQIRFHAASAAKKQAKKYLSENYRDIYDSTVPISVSYNSDIDENGQKVIFYRAWATDNKGNNDLCLFYDKNGVLVNDCVKTTISPAEAGITATALITPTM